MRGLRPPQRGLRRRVERRPVVVPTQSGQRSPPKAPVPRTRGEVVGADRDRIQPMACLALSVSCTVIGVLRTGGRQQLACAVSLGLACVFAVLVTPAYAGRFGSPWQSRVVVDRTVLYAQADRTSAAIGPLARGQIVVVTGESKADDGTDWTQTPDGFVLSSDVAEDITP